MTEKTAERLRTLADSLARLRGPGPVGPNRKRENEPLVFHHEEGERSEYKVDALIAEAKSGKPIDTLNLDATWGEQAREHETHKVGCIEAVVIHDDPTTAAEVAAKQRAAGERPTIGSIATEMLELDERTADRLFLGPADAGAARRWISPEQAAEACRRAADGASAARTWAHTDRAALHEAARTEDFASIHSTETEHELEEWKSGETENAVPIYEATSEEPAEYPELDVTAERALIENSWRDRGKWNLIPESASIHPSVQIHGRTTKQMESGVRIEAGASLRGECDLRRNAVVHEGATVDRTAVMENASIGRNASVHGASVHENAVVEPDAQINAPEYRGRVMVDERARIGRGAKVVASSADGVYVKQGTHVPAGATVRETPADVPAKGLPALPGGANPNPPKAPGSAAGHAAAQARNRDAGSHNR